MTRLTETHFTHTKEYKKVDQTVATLLVKIQELLAMLAMAKAMMIPFTDLKNKTPDWLYKVLSAVEDVEEKCIATVEYLKKLKSTPVTIIDVESQDSTQATAPVKRKRKNNDDVH